MANCYWINVFWHSIAWIQSLQYIGIFKGRHQNIQMSIVLPKYSANICVHQSLYSFQWWSISCARGAINREHSNLLGLRREKSGRKIQKQAAAAPAVLGHWAIPACFQRGLRRRRGFIASGRSFRSVIRKSGALSRARREGAYKWPRILIKKFFPPTLPGRAAMCAHPHAARVKYAHTDGRARRGRAHLSTFDSRRARAKRKKS